MCTRDIDWLDMDLKNIMQSWMLWMIQVSFKLLLSERPSIILRKFSVPYQDWRDGGRKGGIPAGSGKSELLDLFKLKKKFKIRWTQKLSHNSYLTNLMT